MIPRLLIRTLIALLGLALACAAALAWLLPASTPATQSFVGLQSTDVESAKRLLQRSQLREAFHGKPLTLTVPQLELNAVLQDMSRRMLGGSAHATLGTGQADLTLSVPITRTPLRALAPLGSWINVYATVRTAPQGLPALASLRVGRLPLPPAWALWAARREAAKHQLLEPVDIALSTVVQATVQPSAAQVTLRWHDDLTTRAFALLVPREDWERLHVYHQQLASLLQPAAQPGTPLPPALPLIDVMRPLFEHARQRTMSQALSASDGDATTDVAVRENRAVLLALALHAGQIPAGRLIPMARSWPALPARPLLLHGRGDFAQHYVLSALLATSLGGRLADAAGIYKELLDSTPGGHGSGFSFNDIAADKAGNRFGQRALRNPMEVQARVAEGDRDGFFMPSVADLPEFLTAQDFQQRFGGTGAPAYNAMLADIDRRVDQLEVLR